MKKVRTRFAPSPTGYMHLGNLRTALYTWLFARNQGGTFVLRIEDTDQERRVEGAVEVIYKSLKLAGLDWGRRPGRGRRLRPVYPERATKSIHALRQRACRKRTRILLFFAKKERLGHLAGESLGRRRNVFKYDKHCLSLSLKEVQAKIDSGEQYVIRQNVPVEGSASFDDAIFGRIEVKKQRLGTMLCSFKSDGMPTYNFANVVDDHVMDITHVMRGSEYLSSTPRYNLLYDAFGWDKPTYIHLSPVMANAQRKLSKRKGDPSFEDLLAQGYLIDAVVNYMALLGWSPGTDREMFTLSELVSEFSFKRAF